MPENSSVSGAPLNLDLDFAPVANNETSKSGDNYKIITSMLLLVCFRTST